MRFFKMDNSTKRLFEVVIDDLDKVLSQAVDKHERGPGTSIGNCPALTFHSTLIPKVGSICFTVRAFQKQTSFKNKPGWIETQKINSSKQQGVC